MFSRGDEAENSVPAGSNSATDGSIIPSILGSDVTITGDVIGRGEVQIDGTIVGNIRSDKLTLGETSTVEGRIEASQVRLAGSLLGDVSAEIVALTESARMTGDITQESLAIEAGATFCGQVRKRQ